MSAQPDLVDYYAKRAAEYERVYEKPERRGDLALLRQAIPSLLAGRRVLEVACGTGYWTALIAPAAASVTAVDIAPETLAIARLKALPPGRVTYEIGNAFSLGGIAGDFDAAFAGFWWSHIQLQKTAAFLDGLHGRLVRGSRVVLVDNRYVEGSNHPILRTDAAGNTYQRRSLDNGEEHEVLKNFPSPDVLRGVLVAAGGEEIEITALEYYWMASYSVSTRSIHGR